MVIPTYSLDEDVDLVRAFERPCLGEAAGRLWELVHRVGGVFWNTMKGRDSGKKKRVW